MQTNSHQTITVQFGPDSAVAIVVAVTDSVGDAAGDAPGEREATLDQEARETLLRRALATPALVSQLNALVQGDVTLDHGTADERTLPRCTGGRVYQW